MIIMINIIKNMMNGLIFNGNKIKKIKMIIGMKQENIILIKHYNIQKILYDFVYYFIKII